MGQWDLENDHERRILALEDGLTEVRRLVLAIGLLTLVGAIIFFVATA